MTSHACRFFLILAGAFSALTGVAPSQVPTGPRLTAGYARAFELGGPVAEVSVDLATLAASRGWRLVATGGGWLMRTPYRRGDDIDRETGTVALGLEARRAITSWSAVHVGGNAGWQHTGLSADVACLDRCPPRPRGTYTGSRSGWGYGAGIGLAGRVSRGLHVVGTYGITRQRLFDAAEPVMSRVQLGVMWDRTWRR